MSGFDDLLAKAEAARQDKPETETVEVMLGGELVTLKFTELGGPAWGAITARNPMRLDVEVDQNRGYNVHAASQEAAVVSGVRVEGGEDFPLTPEQWARIWPVLSGGEFENICSVIWGLNVWGPALRIEKAKKGLRVTRAPKKK